MGDGKIDNYIPQCGDFIKLDITIGATGHEQQGLRHALVVSRNTLNNVGSLIIICPVTHTDNRHPLHLEIPQGLSTDGFILVDQVRSIDYAGRGVQYQGKCTPTLLIEVLRILRVLMFPKDFKDFKS